MIKVLAVGHCYMDVVPRRKWYVLRDIAPEINTVVVTPKRWPDAFVRLRSEKCSSARLRFVPFNTLFEGYGSRYFYTSPYLPFLLRDFQPDIIHVDHEPWAVVYSQITLLRRLFTPKSKQVVFSWWNKPKRIPFPWSVLHRTCLNATDLLIAGSEGAVQVHRTHGYTGPIEILPQFGVDVDLFSPGPPEDDLNKGLGFGSSFVVGFVGQLKPEKGVNVLLKALSKISSLDWKALIVGSGPSRNALESQVDSLNLRGRVVFTGFIPQTDVVRYIRCMTVLVLPSTFAQWEQFGHVLIEAMACGKPVIGSESGEIPNVIRDAGMVFPIDDHVVLAKHLKTLIQSPETTAEYRYRGLARVQEKYSEAVIAQRLRALYEQIHMGDGNV